MMINKNTWPSFLIITSYQPSLFSIHYQSIIRRYLPLSIRYHFIINHE